MPFQRPSLQDLIERARNDFAVILNVAPLRRSVEDVLALVVAGAAHGLHGHIAWGAEQILPDTADDDFVIRWARLLGLELLPSQTATGTATFTSTGAGIGAGVQAATADGQEYEVRIAAGENGGNVSVFLAALEPGAAATPALGPPITLTTPIAGVESTGTIGTMSGGSEIETIDELRARVLRTLSTPPRGGADGDYAAWALEVPGVARAWERENGAGTILLCFLDGVAGTSQLLFPAPARETEVRDYVGDRAPLNQTVTVDGPTAAPVNFTFSALTPNTPEVQAAVRTELEAMFFRETAMPYPAAGPVPGADDPDGTIPISKIREAISAAAGEEDYTLTSPTADVSPPSEGSINVLGTITFP